MEERKKEEIKLVRAALKKIGTQQELANYLGLSGSSSVRIWLSGTRPLPDKYLIQMMDIVNKNTNENIRVNEQI